MTREKFIDQVIEVVKQRFPLVKIARDDKQNFSLKINGHVAPMENLYRICELQPEGLQHHIERWTVELIRAGEGTPDQDAKFDDIKERILPIVVAENGGEPSDKMVTQPLVPGLEVAYAVDNDRTVTYIPNAYLKRWKVSVEKLHETAIHNLVSKSETINAHAAQDDDGRINLILFQTMDGFDASRILLPTLHDRLREHLGNQFAAAIPNRDILLCFRDDTETVDRLRDQIATDFRQMPHQITDKILLITPDGIAPHD